MLKTILGVFVAGCILLVIFGIAMAVLGSGSSDHHTSFSNSSPMSDEASAPIQTIPVSALKLSFDYHENEVQADNIYKNRWLSVRGMVMEIRKDFADDIIIAIGPTENQFEPVDAHLLAKESAKAAALHKWQIVEVVCKGDGMIVGSPQLSDCSLRENGVKQSPEVSQPTYQQPAATPESKGSGTTIGNSSEPEDQSAPAPIVREPPPPAQPHN